LWCPTHIMLYFCFVCFRLVASFSGLSIFDCPSEFSNVYFKNKPHNCLCWSVCSI
jgi:hypothetical protein